MYGRKSESKWARFARQDFSEQPIDPPVNIDEHLLAAAAIEALEPFDPPPPAGIPQSALEAQPISQSALEAAYAAGNGQIYTLNIPAGQEPDIFVLGCQGNGHISQKDVAELMNRIAAGKKPDFILFLGDNFYDHGVSSPTDPIFKKNFTDIYANPALTHIAGIPCFPILGNHDENIHKLKKPWDSKGIKRGMFQVARSYLAETVTGIGNQIRKVFSTQDKVKLYQQKNLDLASLPKWNMPSRYYSLIAGNTQIFCIDSNTYVEDYLKYQAALKFGKEIDPNNQAVWLEREVTKAKAAGRKVILASHHPILTPGKRSFESDTKLYLDSGTRVLFERVYKDFYDGKQTIKTNKESYNTLLHETFKMQWKNQQRQNKDFTFDTIFAAHDHDLYSMSNKDKPDEFPVYEIVSGGGGGHLQNLMKHDNHLGFFMKQNGFVRCEQFEGEFGEPTLKYHVYTTAARDQEHHLVFTEKSKEPIRNYQTLTDDEQKLVKSFCNTVREAIDEYLKFVTSKQTKHHGKFFFRNFSHGEKGVEKAHKLWAYISNHEVDSFAKTVRTVSDIVKWSSLFAIPAEHSLVKILDKKVKEHYKGTGLVALHTLAMEREININNSIRP